MSAGFLQVGVNDPMIMHPGHGSSTWTPGFGKLERKTSHDDVLPECLELPPGSSSILLWSPVVLWRCEQIEAPVSMTAQCCGVSPISRELRHATECIYSPAVTSNHIVALFANLTVR